jgi:hypothetical protein
MLEGWGESIIYEFTIFNNGWLFKILIYFTKKFCLIFIFVFVFLDNLYNYKFISFLNKNTLLSYYIYNNIIILY